MPNYNYLCDTCDSLTEEFYKYSDRPDTIACACGGTATHTITAVGLMVKEAFLDGTKRKGWSEMREASKMNKQIGVTRDEKEKKRIEGEIRKLGVNIRK